RANKTAYFWLDNHKLILLKTSGVNNGRHYRVLPDRKQLFICLCSTAYWHAGARSSSTLRLNSLIQITLITTNRSRGIAHVLPHVCHGYTHLFRYSLSVILPHSGLASPAATRQ